jgi:thymidylate synthase (FAD)
VLGGGAKYVDIKSIESIGIQPVFDISVEGHHNFIGNGFVVHNSWNERSMRYKDSVIDVFVPDMFRGRPDKLHDGSTDLDVGNNGTDFNVQEYTEDGLHLRNRSLLINELYEKAISDSVQIYETLVSSGLAPEQARFIIPQGMITRWVWTGSLYGWYSVYKQRSSEHAQYEVREFARQLDEQMSKLFPIAWQALKDSDNID